MLALEAIQSRLWNSHYCLQATVTHKDPFTSKNLSFLICKMGDSNACLVGLF